MPSIPRVAHVVISLAHGGLERLVVDWTNARNRRYPGSTEVWCLDESGDLAAQVSGDVVHAFHADRARWPWDTGVVREMRRRGQEAGGRRQEAGDQGMVDGLCNHSSLILHSHTLASQQYAVLAARGTGVSHIHTQHGAHVHLSSAVNRWRSRLLCGMTDGLVAVAESVAEVMSRTQGVPRERIKVIHNGVSPHPVYPEAEITALRESLGLSDEDRVVGSVGRLDYVKGHDRLIKAMSALRAEGMVDLKLLLVGDGPARSDLVRQAAESGLDDQVVFAGFQPVARKCLELMDLFVLPSRSEGLSVALLEAMAAGVPVLATDAGSNRDVLADGEAGTVLPEDERQWPAAVAAALSGREVVRKMTAAAVQRVANGYSFQTAMDRYEEWYKALAG